jgi:hypothetical protein
MDVGRALQWWESGALAAKMGTFRGRSLPILREGGETSVEAREAAAQVKRTLKWKPHHTLFTDIFFLI